MSEENKNNSADSEVIDKEQDAENISVQKTMPFSMVASGVNQKKFIIVIIMAIVIISLYFIFFQSDGDKQVKNNKTNKAEIVQQSVSVAKNDNIESLPPTPTQAPISSPPPLKEVQLPAPPPPPTPVAPPTPVMAPPPMSSSSGQSSSSMNTIPMLSSNSNNSDIAKAKMEANSLVFGGSGSSDSKDSNSPFDKNKKDGEDKGDKNKKKTNYMGFDGGIIDKDSLEDTSSAQIIATRASKNLERSLLQGKIIEGVLETAINTDIGSSPATIRAIVSRDVYGEQNNIILIPKGSRAIGTYSPGQQNGQTRVVAKWDRIITPTGIDIQISSLGVDPLGRVGIAAYTDDHFWGQMASALMVSLLIPYLVVKATNTGNQPVNNVITNNNSPEIIAINVYIATNPTANAQMMANALAGNVTAQAIAKISPTATGTALSSIVASYSANNAGVNGANVLGQVMSQGVNQFQGVATDTVTKRFPSDVTMVIDQGTKIAILVQKDIIFPAQAIATSNYGLLP